MAHEYGHVYPRHVQKGMDRQYMTMGAAAAAGAAGYAAGGSAHGAEYGSTFAGAAMAGGQFLGMGFTRKDEAQADELGFNFYTHAGWDPAKFSEFFKQMIAQGYDKTPAVASDHPTLASRVEDADKRVKELPAEAKKWRKAPIADDAKFKQLQAHAAQLAKTMPDDKQMEGAQTLLAAFSNCMLPDPGPEQAKARQTVDAAAQPKKKSSKKKQSQ
jgi:predicted Zn-dependent protease